MLIHPTAVIHPEARLASNVSVGAHAVIEGPAEIGEGCIIHAHAVICGHVAMGRENVIGHGAVIGGDPQDFAFRPEIQSHVRLGDRNKIREHCTIHRGTTEGSTTVVGNECFLMAGTHLAHNVSLGNKVVIANNSLLGGYVQVEDGVFIGGACVFHQHIRVGRLAITQGKGGFGKDIPPFTMGVQTNRIAGMNVIGLRRAGFSREERQEVKDAFKLLYLSGLNTGQALEAAAARTWGPAGTAFFEFVSAAKKRGICGFLRTGEKGGEGED
jgi:UDP-N-acetylglucosamine acyltransferase